MPIARSLQRIPFWRLNVAIWLSVAVLFFLRLQLHLDLTSSLLFSLFQLCCCLLLASVLHATYSKLERHLGFGVEMAGWIIGLSLVATAIQSTLAHGLLSVAGWHAPNWSHLELFLMRVMFFWLVYLSWSLFFFWVRAEKSAQQSQRAALEAKASADRMETEMLRSQLDPHFLFNALNAIASCAQPNSPAAAATARELASYLRYSLDHRHDTAVSLPEEIDAMMAYLRIEKVRYEESIDVKVEVAPPASSRHLPCFLLLPLVENAVKHSSRYCQPPWNIRIQAAAQGDTLRVSVSNPGSLDGSHSTSCGAGLEILRRRLELHYPGRHRFSLTEEEARVTAQLELEGEPCFA